MSSLLFTFGFVSALRTLRMFSSKRIFENKALTKIGTLLVFMLFGLVYLLQIHFWIRVFLTANLLLLTSCFPLFIVQRREMRLLNCLIEKLDSIQIFMGMGASFRSAFQSIITRENDYAVKSQLIKMYRIVTFPQQNMGIFSHYRLNFLAKELKSIDESDFDAKKRLHNLRTYQKILSDFRRKSGKVKSQVYLQIWILSGIFVALLGFVSFFFDISKVWEPVLLSIFLVCVGHIVAWRAGRKVRWRL